nr:ribonuclease H-like domain-containing protein [Tanacetum cinerariifolium]
MWSLNLALSKNAYNMSQYTSQQAAFYTRPLSLPGFPPHNVTGYQPTIIGPSSQHGQPGQTSSGQQVPGQTNLGQQVPGQSAILGQLLGQETVLPHAFSTMKFQDHTTGAWNMDTGASSYFNSSVTSLNTVFNTCMYPSISVGDGHSIAVTNTSHSILPTPTKSLHLNNVLITPHIVKNLIYVRQFVCNSNCTIEFDAFGFFVKDFLTRRVLLRCDGMGDLYPVTTPSPIRHAFLVSQHMWYQCLGYPGGEVLRRLVSSNFISYKKEKPPVLCMLVSLANTAHMVNCNPSRTLIDTESKIGSDGDMVCLYMHGPREPYFSALKRTLRYVRGTLDYELQLFYSSTTDLVASFDADWVGCPTTRRSSSGYYVFPGNNLLSCSSKGQLTLSRSSVEAEYRGVTNAVAETCWLRNLLRELHTSLSSATLVYFDNVRVLHVPSRYQYANIFTKGLPSTLFEEFRFSLSVWCPPALTAEEC